MLRRFLAYLYDFSGMLAAVMLIGICATVLVQIVARTAGIPFDGIEISSFLLAGMSFLGLAYTWRRGRHLRITLLLDALSPRGRYILNVCSCLSAACLCTYFTYHYGLYAMDSFTFGYKSRGLIAIPLWVPQGSLAVGLVIFLVAILDDTISLLAGRGASYENAGDDLTKSGH